MRFWGYQSSIECSFFITTDALKRVQPNVRADEAGFLNAFDANRRLICKVAEKVYARGRRGSYELVATDF